MWTVPRGGGNLAMLDGGWRFSIGGPSMAGQDGAGRGVLVVRGSVFGVCVGDRVWVAAGARGAA